MQVPDAATVRAVVEAAIRAPSVHNTQPWSWEWDGESLHLRADWDRRLRHGDPDGRDLLISCGAALHHATTAAAALGWPAMVTRLPHHPDGRTLATLRLAPGPAHSMGEAALEAIEARVTDRRTPSGRMVPRGQVDGLVRVVQTHGALATVLPDEATDDLRDLMLLSSVIQESSLDYLEELDTWTRRDDGSGVPASSRLFLASGRAHAAETRFPSGRLLDSAEGRRPRQSWILLTTSSDDVISRIRAGEALSAALLLGTLQGLAIVPYTQPIEVDTTRWGLEASLLRGSSNLQVILRVAVPPSGRVDVRRTRRRPVDEVLTTARLARVPVE